MFQIVKMDDVVRVPPNRFREPINDVAREILSGRYESSIDPELGYLISIINYLKQE